ncbi:uracil-DNA glycosylase [Paenibacillus antarcticus]|uniref:Uracil-DNA glycosylase n=1 Tax=Paenibacillus antarcticus TaxID=253703 RepID=A0A168KYJ4_9BACL|nr:uracil-DNA glycosylase [Paenibacillus antarcticus]OAB42630.1 uracil-DNA glycosylase [Paenibacillus antarcticus]
MSESQRIDCTKCSFYYVTWDPQLPKGCKAFGFKTKTMPSTAVLSSSGRPCMNFELKERLR